MINQEAHKFFNTNNRILSQATEFDFFNAIVIFSKCSWKILQK